MLEQQQQRKKKRKNKQERSRRKKGGGSRRRRWKMFRSKKTRHPRTFCNGLWSTQRRFLQDPIPPMLGTPIMIQEIPRGEGRMARQDRGLQEELGGRVQLTFTQG